MAYLVYPVLISYLIIVGNLPAFANDGKTIYNVPDLVELALKRSELLSAAEKSAESAKWSKNMAGAWQNPSVSIAAGNKSTSEKNGIAYDASVTQPFYFPGKQRLAEDVAGVQERMAGIGLAETRLYVRYSVIRLSYQYAVALELAKHLEERVNRFNTIRKYLTSRPFPSPKKRMEKHVVEMKLTLLRKSLEDVRSGKDIIWARLNLFLDFQGPVSIEAPWFRKGISLEWDGLLAGVEYGNLDLNKQLLVLERTKKETDLARKYTHSDFNLSFLYREDRVPEVERFIGGGITFSVPLLNSNRSGVKSMEAMIDAETTKAAFVKRETSQLLVSSFIEYDIARKNLEWLPMSMLDGVHARLADADSSFDKGLIDLLTFGEVESQAYDTHLAVLGAQYEYVEKYAAILILQGSADFVFPADTVGRENQ